MTRASAYYSRRQRAPPTRADSLICIAYGDKKFLQTTRKNTRVKLLGARDAFLRKFFAKLCVSREFFYAFRECAAVAVFESKRGASCKPFERASTGNSGGQSKRHGFGERYGAIL